MESQTMEQMAKKQSVYNKERYEQNKEEILEYRRERYRCVPNVFLVCLLKYRRERYRTIHKKDLNISVRTGTCTLYFD